jgi:hypothetical protein
MHAPPGRPLAGVRNPGMAGPSPADRHPMGAASTVGWGEGGGKVAAEEGLSVPDVEPTAPGT